MALFPGGREVLCTGDTKLLRLDLATGETTSLGNAGYGRSIAPHAILSPDGKMAVFVRFRALSLSERKDMAVMDLTTGKVTILMRDRTFAGGFWME